MKRKNEEFKFIGLDGFSEIESIVPDKEVKPNVQAPKKASSKQKSKWAALGSKLKASKTKSQPIHTKGGARAHTVYKKRAVIAVGASVTAVMLSLVTVASALDANTNSNPPQTTAATAAAAKVPATLDEAISLVTASKTMQAADKDAAPAGLTALYIDGELIGVVKDGAALQQALDKILADAREGYDDTTTTEFANKVEVKPYTGDKTPETVESLMEYSKYMYSIKTETDWIYESEVDFETETTYDDSKPAGYEEVTQEGQKGVTQTTIRLSLVDGVQTDAVVTDEKVIIEAVKEKKIVGSGYSESETNDNDSYSESGSSETHASGSGTSTGSFIWPLPHTHNITSYMEYRWGRMHNGIDIAGGDDYGQPFVAADGGTVVWSGDDGGGYGNYVMIDHGNGYMTVYGHASELACSTGDYVSQGQVIGYVGSTGNSTGPHLHFEIRLNGDYQDPLGYVS